MTPIIAFNTANLVARVSGYRFKLSNWMEQHHHMRLYLIKLWATCS
ncbi:MAG: hypothetical protein WC058_02230 [Phycisphaeraceae bacterium]